MKTIGLLGGISWESTQEYYRILNQEIQKKLGSNHSSRIVMYSVDFYDLEACIASGNMQKLSELLSEAAQKIEKGGADCLLMCANTVHMLADAIQAKINIPLIHIAKETLKKVSEAEFKKVGLLGTKPTMEMGFYKNIFNEKGIEVLIPDAEERQFIQDTIFKELFSGHLNDTSRKRFLTIMDSLVSQGAQGIILGCTEIPLLIKQEHTSIHLFDTTYIHACAGVDFALTKS